MTYNYVYHLRNLTSHDPANFLLAKRILLQLASDRITCTPLSFDVSFLQDPCEYLHCQKVAFLSYMTAAIVRLYLHLVLRSCFRKPREDGQGEH